MGVTLAYKRAKRYFDSYMYTHNPNLLVFETKRECPLFCKSLGICDQLTLNTNYNIINDMPLKVTMYLRTNLADTKFNPR